jgi:hypothetical protein
VVLAAVSSVVWFTVGFVGGVAFTFAAALALTIVHPGPED